MDWFEADVKKLEAQLVEFVSIQEIHEFSLEWQKNQSVNRNNVEMSFYKDTWTKMQAF